MSEVPARVASQVQPKDLLSAFMVGPVLLDEGSRVGPLRGTRFAVKDLFDVAGERTGAGNPQWSSGALAAKTHAPAVSSLLDAGAELWGKTVTDELAYSLSGTNVHYGTPINSNAPGRVPGGSSSGSAAAVAGGVVGLALGTDTGGSTRVPASYCGVFGLRPTHGRIDVSGLVPLAPSFDTVGILATDGPLLSRGWEALVAGAQVSGSKFDSRQVRRVVASADLFALSDPSVRPALFDAMHHLVERLDLELVEGILAGTEELLRWRQAFRVIQQVEAWRTHGQWISEHQPKFGPGIRERFAAAAVADPEAATTALSVRDDVLRSLEDLLGDDGVLVQPAVSGPAPPLILDATAKDDLRSRTLALTAPAGMAGAPVVTLPLAQADGLPIGLALVGLPGDDDVIIQMAARGCVRPERRSVLRQAADRSL